MAGWKPCSALFISTAIGAARCICIDNAPPPLPSLVRVSSRWNVIYCQASLVLPRRGKNIINLGAFAVVRGQRNTSIRTKRYALHSRNTFVPTLPIEQDRRWTPLESFTLQVFLDTGERKIRGIFFFFCEMDDDLNFNAWKFNRKLGGNWDYEKNCKRYIIETKIIFRIISISSLRNFYINELFFCEN